MPDSGYATSYNSGADSEKSIPLPNAPLIRLASNVTLQPPLTRSGSGPGLLIFVPPTPTSNDASSSSMKTKKPIDPPPSYKWAEEGYCVLEMTVGSGRRESWGIIEVLQKGLDALVSLKEFTGDKVGVIVYERAVLPAFLTQLRVFPILCAIVSYSKIGHTMHTCPDDDLCDFRDFPPGLPVLVHLPSEEEPRWQSQPLPPFVKVYKYNTSSSYFSLPTHPATYDYTLASLAHSRTLDFLKKPNAVGGPLFDLEAIWEEHTLYEFEERSVAKTMATLVAEPYVNHVPTLTGGIGREALSAFYRDHFIFANPPDMAMELVSRTTGVDRVVDEFVMHFTHTTQVDWLIPGVPPTGKVVAVPMMSVVCVRGDRLYHEHITWDQATVFKQLGLLPSHVTTLYASEGSEDKKIEVRLPTAGVETTTKLKDKDAWPSNDMLGPEWGAKSES